MWVIIQTEGLSAYLSNKNSFAKPPNYELVPE